MDNIYNSIQTNVTEGMTVNTYVQDTPQVQTVLQDGTTPISTIVNAPFVAVTSVNGMTGDVITTVVVGDFIPNHYYVKGTFISYNGQNYLAKENFTAGATFNENDWFTVAGKDGLMGAKVDGDILELMNTIVVDQSNYYTKTEVDEKISQIDLVDYVKKTDYATSTTAGIVKAGAYYDLLVDNEGRLMPAISNYQRYLTRDNSTFVAKGTLENVVAAREYHGTHTLTQTELDAQAAAGTLVEGDWYGITGA